MQPGLISSEIQTPPRLRQTEFDDIRRLAYDHFGLDLKHGKQNLVLTRLSKELRRLHLTSFDQYVRHVSSDRSGEALVEMADALTTNFTSFMREKAHFEFLRTHIAPRLAKSGPIEIWSAACSSGEEPYSILFTMLEALGPLADIRILGTDVSTRALKSASEATYESSRVAGFPPGWLERYFLKGNGKCQGWYRVRPQYRAMVAFRRFNLVTDPPGVSQYANIFCRNVAIYFDKPTQAALARKLASVLKPGGHLFIGHSESLTGMDHGLAYVQPAIHRKNGNSLA
jgi:chemotaxis protein methyltransferase CheR